MWLKSDGTLDLDALDALAANVRAVTDSNKAIDAVIKGAKLGAPTVVAFRCSHSGMFHPADYIKGWGKDYGVGLGSSPVSESLNTMYGVDPSVNPKNARSIAALMHPVEHSLAQVDFSVVAESDYNASQLIAAKDDEGMIERMKVIYQRQLVNPNSQLRLLVAQYNAIKLPAVTK